MTQVRETKIPDCLEVALPHFPDSRGSFTKTFQRSTFERLGLPTDFAEHYHSSSDAGVVRGLHFQSPPNALDKLVVCIHGRAWDVVLDLRTDSPAYGQHWASTLTAERGIAVRVPTGCAHGFLALEPGTVLGYWVTAEHAVESDGGVRWDSAGIQWPLEAEPVVSRRDAALPALADFASPFTMARR